MNTEFPEIAATKEVEKVITVSLEECKTGERKTKSLFMFSPIKFFVMA